MGNGHKCAICLSLDWNQSWSSAGVRDYLSPMCPPQDTALPTTFVKSSFLFPSTFVSLSAAQTFVCGKSDDQFRSIQTGPSATDYHSCGQSHWDQSLVCLFFPILVFDVELSEVPLSAVVQLMTGGQLWLHEQQAKNKTDQCVSLYHGLCRRKKKKKPATTSNCPSWTRLKYHFALVDKCCTT